MGQVSLEVKKQAANTIEKTAKARLIEISNKLKGIAQEFPNRFEYLINEIEEVGIPVNEKHKDLSLTVH